MVGLSGCGTDRRPDYPPHLHNVVSNDDAMVSRTLSGENVKAAEILLIDYGDGKVAGVVYIVPAGGQEFVVRAVAYGRRTGNAATNDFVLKTDGTIVEASAEHIERLKHATDEK